MTKHFTERNGNKKSSSGNDIQECTRTNEHYIHTETSGGAAKQQTINISHIIIIIKAKDRGTFNQQCQYKFTFFGYYKMRISNERGFLLKSKRK